MSHKNVILARPNLFIINEMKRLMSDCAYIPAPIAEINELEKFDSSGVRGIVISTGLHSPVQASYTEVIARAQKEFPGKPILLASMIDYKNMKRALELNFEREGIDCQLFSIDEANEKGLLDRGKELIVIQKSDITDTEQYPITKAVVEKFFA